MTDQPIQTMSGKGSTANVIAAVCSFFIPGLGQLTQGRWAKALFHVILWGLLWLLTFGSLWWLMNIWSCFEAAIHRPDLR
jgi:TM2 domain-containing membrane protein YozV